MLQIVAAALVLLLSASLSEPNTRSKSASVASRRSMMSLLRSRAGRVGIGETISVVWQVALVVRLPTTTGRQVFEHGADLGVAFDAPAPGSRHRSGKSGRARTAGRL
jgi:hypothetical protein